MMKRLGQPAAAAIAVAASVCRLLLVRVRRPPPFGMRKVAVIAVAFGAACTGKRVGQCERGGREGKARCSASGAQVTDCCCCCCSCVEVSTTVIDHADNDASLQFILMHNLNPPPLLLLRREINF